MPAAPCQSRMPAGLSAEEKREYQKERNRRKQAALRSRRLAERELATKNDDSPPAPPSLAASAGGGPSTLPEAECEVTRLERVVERLSGMLRALGVEESEISRAVAGEGNPCGAEGRRTDESGGMSSTASSSSQSFDSPAGSLDCQWPSLPLADPAFTPTAGGPSSSYGSFSSWTSSEDPFGLEPPLNLPSYTHKPLQEPPSHLTEDIFKYVSPNAVQPVAPAPSLEVDRLRRALNLTHQAVPSPLSWNAPFSDFSDHSNAFFGGGGGGLSGFGGMPQSVYAAPLPVETSGASWKRTLFDLHRAYRTSKRRSRVDSTHTTTISEAAIKEVQTVIFRLLNATSDQYLAYFGSDPPLSAEDQAFFDSDAMDERIRLMPTAPIVRVATGRATGLGIFDLSVMLAEVIETSRIYGDVNDLTGWTLPETFWTEYPMRPPPEMELECSNETQGAAIPKYLKGATIREIILNIEQPGWRTAGPFPLPQTDESPFVEWQTSYKWSGGEMPVAV